LQIDGMNLAPLLEDPSADWPDRTLFIQTHRGSAPRRYHNCAAISQRYKWLGYPGTGGRWTMETSQTDPVMELYDMEQDPGEQNDLAEQQSEVVQQMRQAYDDWFDEVAGNWKPGIIHIGNEAENPIGLCRYQDSEYQDEIPFGWRVKIERGGTYEVRINRGSLDGPGALGVAWQGRTHTEPLENGQDSGRFSLPAGEGRLEVWFELADIGRITFSSNETIGDVEMEWVGA
ncbi:MAG: hypothetical protein O7G87_05270, partial [bacterium]|nr:hypothetical protein [bacterium]